MLFRSRIELNSQFGYLGSKKWDYSVMINFRSQFNYGYNSTAEMDSNKYFSNLLSPSYTVIALGFNYSPNQDLTCFISPCTYKMTTVLDDSLSNIGAFGVSEGMNIRTEIGGYLKLLYQKKEPFKIKDLTFKTNLTLFTNYIDSPQNIDVTWETLTCLNVNKHFAFIISTYLLYDHDIQIGRFKEDGVTPVYYSMDDGTFYLNSEGNPIQKKGPVTQFKQSFSFGLSFIF